MGNPMPEFYSEMHDGVEVMNMGDLPLLLLASISGQRIGSDRWLQINHPMRASNDADNLLKVTLTSFHTITGMWRDGQFVTLTLAGERMSHDIFVQFKYRMCNKALFSLVFSPVPFGRNGKPILPEVEGGMLLEAVHVVLSSDVPEYGWGYRALTNVLRGISDEHAQDLLAALQYKLHVLRLEDDKWLPAMQEYRFEGIFDVTLPKSEIK